MRILLVNWQDLDNPQAGGAEIHLFELFARLVSRGHQVHLICSGWAGGSPTATVRGLTVERHGDRHTFALKGRRAVARALQRARYDVVVEDINKLPLYLAGLCQLPICLIIPHLFGMTAYREASWPMATAVVLAEQLMPWAYRRAAWHSISESTRDDLVARGVPGSRITVIHPGVDAGHFRPATGLDRSAGVSFLYLGRLKRYKGAEFAIRALGIARQTIPNLTLDIAGAGDDRARLEALAHALGLGLATRFCGFVDEATKLSLLQSTVANLFPSPKEGWGITVMEAAACGTLSVASDSPGLRDSVRHGETGFLVPHGDVEQLAQRMLLVARDPGLRAQMGRQARLQAERWSWEDAAIATERHLGAMIAPFDTAQSGGVGP